MLHGHSRCHFAPPHTAAHLNAGDAVSRKHCFQHLPPPSLGISVPAGTSAPESNSVLKLSSNSVLNLSRISVLNLSSNSVLNLSSNSVLNQSSNSVLNKSSMEGMNNVSDLLNFAPHLSQSLVVLVAAEASGVTVPPGAPAPHHTDCAWGTCPTSHRLCLEPRCAGPDVVIGSGSGWLIYNSQPAGQKRDTVLAIDNVTSQSWLRTMSRLTLRVRKQDTQPWLRTMS